MQFVWKCFHRLWCMHYIVGAQSVVSSRSLSEEMLAETRMELKQEESWEPVSPTGQYFNSSVLSVCVLGVLESEVPIDDSPTIALLRDVFLPISPRFSSVMVRDKEGVKQWKKVEVKLEEHVNVPRFPEGKSPEFYDVCLRDYLSNIAMNPLPQSKPLWEIHIIKYPTTHSAGCLVFKLHHALGDGFSLMGALLSCMQRADDPTLPLSFPTLQTNPGLESARSVSRLLSGMFNTFKDFGWSLLKSSLVEDDRTPIRSGDDGVEFRPITITTIALSLDQLKQIKTKLQVTINDVICGVIFLGTRLYMQSAKHEQRNAETTALVLLNTRNIGGYKSVDEMVEPHSESPWGNQFGFLHVSVPKLNEPKLSEPLDFVFKVQHIIKRKRNSSAVFLTGKLLEALRIYRGPETTAQYIHSTLKNSSMTVSNMIGPVEQMSLANHPIRGLYFMVVGIPQSLTITMVSYMNKLRMAVGTNDGLINPDRYKSCVENAFDMIFDAAVNSELKTKS